MVNDLLPLIMKAILLQPTTNCRTSDKFNKELYVDFTGAQIKTLSFVAFFIRMFKVVMLIFLNKNYTIILLINIQYFYFLFLILKLTLFFLYFLISWMFFKKNITHLKIIVLYFFIIHKLTLFLLVKRTY